MLSVSGDRKVSSPTWSRENDNSSSGRSLLLSSGEKGGLVSCKMIALNKLNCCRSSSNTSSSSSSISSSSSSSSSICNTSNTICIYRFSLFAHKTTQNGTCHINTYS